MKIKLSSGNIYPIVDIAKTESKLTAAIIMDDTATFEEIESDFISNSDTLYKLNDDGDTIQSYTGYTSYKGARKDPDAVISSTVINTGTEDNPVYERETTTGAVLYVEMAQPDIADAVKDMQETVDYLVEAALEV